MSMGRAAEFQRGSASEGQLSGLASDAAGSAANPTSGIGAGVPANPTLRAALPSDLPAVLALLAAAGLPGGGVADWLSHFVVAQAGGALAGVAGLEVYGDAGLLRSVAVAETWRGRGLGSALTARVLEAARAGGLRAVFLLTDTAGDYFPRHGFRRITRAEVPAAVQESLEFRELCPSSSIVMSTNLESDS